MFILFDNYFLPVVQNVDSILDDVKSLRHDGKTT